MRDLKIFTKNIEQEAVEIERIIKPIYNFKAKN